MNPSDTLKIEVTLAKAEAVHKASTLMFEVKRKDGSIELIDCPPLHLMDDKTTICTLKKGETITPIIQASPIWPVNIKAIVSDALPTR